MDKFDSIQQELREWAKETGGFYILNMEDDTHDGRFALSASADTVMNFLSQLTDAVGISVIEFFLQKRKEARKPLVIEKVVEEVIH